MGRATSKKAQLALTRMVATDLPVSKIFGIPSQVSPETLATAMNEVKNKDFFEKCLKNQLNRTKEMRLLESASWLPDESQSRVIVLHLLADRDKYLYAKQKLISYVFFKYESKAMGGNVISRRATASQPRINQTIARKALDEIAAINKTVTNSAMTHFINLIRDDRMRNRATRGYTSLINTMLAKEFPADEPLRSAAEIKEQTKEFWTPIQNQEAYEVSGVIFKELLGYKEDD